MALLKLLKASTCSLLSLKYPCYKCVGSFVECDESAVCLIRRDQRLLLDESTSDEESLPKSLVSTLSFN